MTQVQGENPFAEEAMREAQRQADEAKADADLAAATGKTPEHVEARQRVARQFIEIHLPEMTAEQVEQFFATVDWSAPVQVVNAAGIDTSLPASRGMLGFRARPQYLVGERFKPQKPDDPVYALRTCPAK